MEISVRTGRGVYSVSVYFPADNCHAWTRASDGSDVPDAYDRPSIKAGPRTLDLERARMMDRLVPTMSNPWKVLGQNDNDVLVQYGKLPSGGAYTAAFAVKRVGHYEFKSAYPRSKEEIERLTREFRSRPPAGLPGNALKKAEPPLFSEGSSAELPFAAPSGRGPMSPLVPGAIVKAHDLDRYPLAAASSLHALLEIFKALQPGERWITVRPPGHDKGQPLLVKPAGDGAMKVIGGAGGSMNHLRLTGVRSPEAYAEEAREKASAAKDARARQTEQDRKMGLTASKAKAREAIRAQVGDHQAKFVKTVADALGWKDEDLRFPEESFANKSPEARAKAAKEHAAALLEKAKEAVQHQRKRLVQDAEARAQAGLGEVPLTSSKPEDLTVQDLDPIAPATKGLGYSTNYQARAEAAGLTPDNLAKEAAAAKPQSEAKGADAAARPRDTAKRVADELKDIREPGPEVDPRAVVDAKVAVELLKAEKMLRAVKKDAREKAKQVDRAKTPVEPKAYVLEQGAPVQESDITRDLENDLRTLRTRAFLDDVGKLGGAQESLGKHIGVGAFNSINSVALAAGGASLVDRSVVDVLGVAGAAQVLARRLGKDLTPSEMDDLRAAMGSFHVDHYMALSDQAMREARDWHGMANEIEVGAAESGHDLAVAQEMNARRREFIDNAQRTLGTALGEMEANAALVVALDHPEKAGGLQVSLGRTTIEAAIQQARAIGLDHGDYQVERAGASVILKVSPDGMDKLAQPVARADMIHTRKALDIMEGREDEDDWLPEGVARRPELAMNAQPGVAPRLAKPFDVGAGGVDQAIADYIGGRTADGDAPADIMQGLLSEDTLRTAGDRKAFLAALDKVAPLHGEDGKMVRAETHQAAFDKMADDFTERHYGAERTPLHRQQFPVDQTSVNALHAALAEHPAGAAAFKPVGDLTPQDQKTLRDTFSAEHAKVDASAAGAQAKLAKLDASPPPKETADMFGTTSVSPEWTAWKAERDAAAEQVNAATMSWGKYVDAMGNPTKAYAAMQDTLKGKVLDAFAKQHNLHRPGAPLKTGRTVIANDLNHLDALDPAARDRRLAQHRDIVDRLRSRVAGKYAAGSVSEKVDAARAADEASSQSQMGLFGSEDPSPTPAAPERPMGLGERRTIGHAAEQQVAGMMPIVGRNFRPGQPVPLWKPSMSGKYVGRQRAVKLIEHDKRIALGLGTGSGKTSIGLSAFTHLKAKGKASRGLFVVPSIVQGEFGAAAATLLQAGKYQWHANPGASREERIAALKDPKNDFNVVTHQAFRDDVLHLAAQHDDSTPDAVAEKLDKMSPPERRDFIKGVLQKEGVTHDYGFVDEGHGLLNRAGKKNSRLANTLDAVMDGMGHYVNATADTIKNDPSEAFDVLRKMNPEKYTDRDAFMRKYGVDTQAAKEGLRREMAAHFYTGRIDPGVKANHSVVKVDLSEEQHARLKELDHAAAAARAARMSGKVDVGAMKTLSPGSFDGVDPDRHEEIAKHLQQSVGIVHNTAKEGAIDGGAKTGALAKIADERRGTPGVVFAHRRATVDEMAARLRRDGHRVVTLTGGNTSAEKDKIKRDFQEGRHDIIIMSDAGAVGANLQRGKYLVQADTSPTAMVHAQRQGRIHRVGQTSDVDLIDLVANHPVEARARKRLANKYALRSVMSTPLEGLDDHGIAGALRQAKAERSERGRSSQA